MADEPLVQVWLPEHNAADLLPHVYPDSVVALQGVTGSAVLCLEIDEATEHGPDIRDKPARYSQALHGRPGWHVVFIAPSRERVEFLARVAKRDGGFPSLVGRVWAVVLRDLNHSALLAVAVPLFLAGNRSSVGELLSDPTPRRCPTPVGSDDWLRILGFGGAEETDDALR